VLDCRLDADAAAVRAHDLVDDVEPEPQPARSPAAGAAAERLEQGAPSAMPVVDTLPRSR
jgi:hypothetical protein